VEAGGCQLTLCGVVLMAGGCQLTLCGVVLMAEHRRSSKAQIADHWEGL